MRFGWRTLAISTLLVLAAGPSVVDVAAQAATSSRPASGGSASPPSAAAPYVSGPSGDWQVRAAEDVGMNAELLQRAIEYAKENETNNVRDLVLSHALSWNREPWDGAVGPVKTRGAPTGIVVRNGYIGASRGWQWHGYANSWVVVDGPRVQSVSGGGHWGGGMWISARDHARFGPLALRGGQWKDRRILSEDWLAMVRTPTEANPGYGFMNFFLNTDRERYPSAPERAFAYLGAGTKMVYIDPVHDLVVVARWIQGGALDGLIERVIAAIQEQRAS